ncbi:GcrA family cell cycle regulator [Tianweitania sediminis]|uniref:GcrA cell cycle regulator n=1 Tax=Tianweitania sediminis TaxID=1502156 RepID=A0A8J7RJK1_9HYPH|nr:hypothetical protein [Tianweitania sediminis]
MTRWNAEARVMVQRLAADGQSATQIAGQLGCTRSSVLGLIHRMQAAGTMPKRERRVSIAKPRTTAPRAAPAVAKPAPLPPTSKSPERSPVDRREARSFTAFRGKAARIVVVPLPFARAIAENRCLFFAADPFSKEGPDMLVCGCPRQFRVRKPYCEAHVAGEAQA